MKEPFTSFPALPKQEAARWNHALRTKVLALMNDTERNVGWRESDDPTEWRYVWEALIGRPDLKTEVALREFLDSEGRCVVLWDLRPLEGWSVPSDFEPDPDDWMDECDSYWISLQQPHRCYVRPHEWMEFGCSIIELEDALPW